MAVPSSPAQLPVLMPNLEPESVWPALSPVV
jgi:hypothetical protein